MITMIKRFFATKEDNLPPISEEEKAKKIHIATCALLFEMANIDGKFSDQEREYIITIFKKDYNLSDEEISDLLDSSQKELDESIDLWQFTNLINQNYTLEEKIRIIKTIWSLAYADGKLTNHEDYLVHKLAELLRLSHKQLIEAKLKVISERG